MSTKKVLVKFPTEVAIDGLDVAVVTGRPASAISVATGTVGLGNCSKRPSSTSMGEVAGWENDSGLTSGTLVGKFIAITNSGDFRKDRLQTVYMNDAFPHGTKISSLVVDPHNDTLIAADAEWAGDASLCQEIVDGAPVTFRKYIATY